MSFKPQLLLQPVQNSTADILKCFTLGKPLSCDQINFVAWHQKQLSSAEFDPVYKYYIETAKKRHEQGSTFLLSAKELNADAAKQFKKRLSLLLEKRTSSVHISLTPEQFSKFRALNFNRIKSSFSSASVNELRSFH